jgi:lysophospholipase L1-like esterase
MKTNLIILIALSFLISGYTMQTKKRIVFFGDSITQQGAGTDGYIKKMDSILAQRNQSANYELVGAGIGGNKVYDLYLRMDNDVLAKNPDAVVIYIGINDVWHKRTSGTGTDPDRYERFYNAITKKLQEKNITVYLCTPSVIGEKTDFTNQLDGDLNQYAVLVKKIAAANKCTVIDLRQAFLDYLKTNNPDNRDRGILTTDGVHLNRAGNIFVAQQIYNTLNKDFIK